MRHRAVSTCLFLMLFLTTQSLIAAEGDVLREVTVPVPSATGIGISIAFDGTYLYYTNYQDSKLYKCSATGVLVSTLETGITEGLGALAYDAGRQKIWAASQDGTGNIYLVDPATGTATFQFSAVGGFSIDDGLAFDGIDDTLWYSNDVASTIYHYSLTGTVLGTLSVSFPSSGLAVGGSIIYAGSNGDGIIYKLDKQTGTTIGTFASPGGRDEDLECDGVTFAPNLALWSKDAYNDKVTAFELECCNTCQLGGGLDSDGDGLLDDWETNGFDWDLDSVVDVDLPAMGADPSVKDIFVEVDWMKTAAHTHLPMAGALQKIIDSFKNQGINIHIDAGAASIMDPQTNATWGALSRSDEVAHVAALGSYSGGYDWTDFQNIKVANFESARLPIFHYMISAHDLGGLGSTSGISRNQSDFSLGAADFIMSLGSWNSNTGTLGQQAGTLMHELGHNLGLRHGGGDHTQYKPNYLSVMNYSFQTRGLIIGGTEGHYDYSRFNLPVLNENALDENVGLNGGAAISTYGTRWYCGGAGQATNNANGNIDWNCVAPATETGVTADINKSGGSTNLSSYDDWANLVFVGGAIGDKGADFSDDIRLTEWTEEIDPDEDAQVANEPPDCSSAQASVSTIWPPNHQMVDVQILGVTDPEGGPITIVITGITQDEPVDGIGDGDTSPDGAGVGTATAQVRAERAGSKGVPGNGRVYQINYTATDEAGEECEGFVSVCVPHDRGHGATCIDDGQNFDATASLPNGVAKNQEPSVSANPNPFNPNTTIAYSVQQRTAVRLEIFDALGRRIRKLVNEVQEPGDHSAVWNGHDDSGQRVVSGIYLYRLTIGASEVRGRLVMIK